MRGHCREDRIAIEIEVYGISADVKRKITALVDTGFSGSLTLAFTEAFPLSLILTGEQSYVLADGTTSRHFVCVGTVVFDGKEVDVAIDVQQSGPVLIGMDLLKKLEKKLCIDFADESFEFHDRSKKS